jgi:hypothetical protein
MKTFKHFEGCLTAQEIKNIFKILVKKHHPDLGGDEETMKEINNEYHEALKACKVSGFAGFEANDEKKEYPFVYDSELETTLQIKIISLLILSEKAGFSISLLGSWIWIEDTKKEDIETREKLKELKCTWNFKRNCWCFNSTGKKSRGSKLTLDGLKEVYQATTIKKRYLLAA